MSAAGGAGGSEVGKGLEVGGAAGKSPEFEG